jgi:2-phosphosulfolactate phosphatase
VTWSDQSGYELRCEWGEHGASVLAPVVDAIVIVDILSFSTCVDVAVARGAEVYPYAWKDASATAFARQIGGVLAGGRDGDGPSLSPASLLNMVAGTKLVLPSPNGAACSRATGLTPTFTACFRNAEAVADAARAIGPRIGVVPAGERWPGGSLRPALEDWLGAGALLRHLAGEASPEAVSARAAYENAARDLRGVLRGCVSGRELIERGFEIDIIMAAERNVSSVSPQVVDAAYRDASTNRGR